MNCTRKQAGDDVLSLLSLALSPSLSLSPPPQSALALPMNVGWETTNGNRRSLAQSRLRFSLRRRLVWFLIVQRIDGSPVCSTLLFRAPFV